MGRLVFVTLLYIARACRRVCPPIHGLDGIIEFRSRYWYRPFRDEFIATLTCYNNEIGIEDFSFFSDGRCVYWDDPDYDNFQQKAHRFIESSCVDQEPYTEAMQDLFGTMFEEGLIEGYIVREIDGRMRTRSIGPVPDPRQIVAKHSTYVFIPVDEKLSQVMLRILFGKRDKEVHGPKPIYAIRLMETVESLLIRTKRDYSLFEFLLSHSRRKMNGIGHEVFGERNQMLLWYSETSELDCSICLDNIGHLDDVSIAEPCSHAFHHKCLMESKRRSNNCPLCRQKLIV